MASMKRRYRTAAVCPFALERLESRSMLAADAIDGLGDLDTGFSPGSFNDTGREYTAIACSFQHADGEAVSPVAGAISIDDSLQNCAGGDSSDALTGESNTLMDDVSTLVTDESGLPEGCSMTLLPFSGVTDFPGIAVDPAVDMTVEPWVIVDQVVFEGPLVEAGTWIDPNASDQGSVEQSSTVVETGVDVTTEVGNSATSPSGEPSDDGDLQVIDEGVFIKPWFRGVNAGGDPVVCVYDGPPIWFAAATSSAAQQGDEVAASVQVAAMDMIADDTARVVVSSGEASPSTRAPDVTAQAFAAFAASATSQGAGDAQPLGGGRRTVRR